ncbi:FAD-dependent oxidoreductase [Bradyrhizobium jicamae]|uniref:FAD-dependent oxidoreductase n=1 Tax=Bradyrhizobium jicamae TaxID=280332 RepID=A0ABS5FT13_9BRAD|nr:FAD-dependent oxidoreductase [Bradyrhizobium jicamae]MBR0799935.1 FAD-dependent oxidoreductase [Bradyrhizobium jicamae]
MTETQVAIVGGGFSGLYAAHLMRRRGVDSFVIEARDRLGGRILTVDETGEAGEDGFDLGPSWCWPQLQPAVGEAIADLDLALFRQYDEGDVIFEPTGREAPQRSPGFSEARQTMRLVGGSAALVRRLARDVPRDRQLLSTCLIAMELTETGIDLTITQSDGSSRRLRAQYVIAALPPRLIEATISFSPQQDRRAAARWRNTPTWMAPHAKFFALYDRPFWREAGLSGIAQSMAGPMAEIYDATTSSGKAALFGFLGIPAERRAAIGEEALTRACLDQLAHIFGSAAKAARKTLLKDWAADKFTATAADRNASAHIVPFSGPWVLAPWDQRLELAGSETSPSDPGYLAGAVVAARRAVNATLARLEVKRGRSHLSVSTDLSRTEGRRAQRSSEA